MNALKNQVQLIGRLGKETELKSLDNGNSLLNFTLATNENYKDKEGNTQTNTEWHRLVAWGKTAELINKHCKKGDELMVQGKLIHRNYEKDGETRYITEVQINEFLVLSKKEA